MVDCGAADAWFMDRLHALVGVVVVLLCAAGAIAAVRPGDRAEADEVKVELSKATRTLEISNSRPGRAVIRGRNMAPGQRRRGRVTLGVSAPARVTLRTARIGRVPGPGGWLLADALTIRVTTIGGGTRRWRRFYDGPLTALHGLRFPRWLPGERHRFRIAVRLPPHPYAQDSVQGASADFDLVWSAFPST